MNIKHKQLLMISSFIDAGLGLFLIICGILEFTGIIYTNANNTIESVGVQLSYLVFISGVLVFLSGGVTLLSRRRLENINLLIFIGVIALAWPIFVSISLFFSQLIICIRLLPTMLSSLFYIIAVLIVKIANEAFRRLHKFNPSAVIENMGKRKSSIDVTRVFNSAGGKKRTGGNIQALGNLVNAGGKQKNSVSAIKRLFYGGTRRRGGGIGKSLYAGSRKRSKFHIRKR